MALRILVANFFPAFHPPRSGGEQRYYYLYHYLSRHHDVTLLSPTYSSSQLEVVAFSPTFREHRVPKDPIFDRLHWQLGTAGIGPECSAYVVSLAGATETRFGLRFATLVTDADVVIHESPFTLPYDRTLRSDGKPRIYNAYNVEHRLAAQILRGEAGRKATEFIRFLEGSLVESAALIFATSEEERDQLVADFGVDRDRIALAPNGFEPDAVGEAATPRSPDATKTDAPLVVFMGSAHPPNAEAASYIVDELGPALPDIEFRLMGAVCGQLSGTLPRNVAKLGFVDEGEKRRQLATCRAALNPVFSGAGTNLKMVDYMASGAPIVTTPLGARGLGLRHGIDAFIAEREHFAEALRATLLDEVCAKSVGAAAKRKAYAELTWERIAERARPDFESVLFGRDRSSIVASEDRPLLLVVNDFPIADATGGGEVRIRELLTELGREFDVIFLCLTQEPQRTERTLAPGVREVRMPKTAEHRHVEVRAGRDATVSIGDIVAADFCARNAELVATFRRHAAGCKAVIFEHPYLAPLLEFVPKGKRVVYSSLNVESDLKAALLARRRDSAHLVARVVELERALLDNADLVVCTSDEDRRRFLQDHPAQRFEIIANGVRSDLHECRETGSLAPTLSTPQGGKLAVFLGSAHMPNVEAAKFLVETVAPVVPEVTFGIIGPVCDALGLTPRPRNVVTFGVLDPAEKNALLARATLAVNPMFGGGGSSLKVADFLGAGLPLVSTRVGVRGYDLRDGEHFVAAERADFAAVVRRVADDAALRQRLAINGRTTAQTTLDWRVLGAGYRRVLRSLISPGAKPRALVVTYRFADPPPGGAEAFLVKVLRELAHRGTLDIDVATCDIASIADKWHFSAEYTRPATRAPNPDYVRAIHRFAVDDPHVEDFARCSRLFKLWMAESRAQAAMLAPQFRQPILLGGWNFPESSAGRTARWTSREAQIHVGSSATALTLEGFSPVSTRVSVLRGGAQLASRQLNGRFDWKQPLTGDDPVVTLRVESSFAAPGDPRELGVVVDAISVHEGGKSRAVDLADDFAAVTRRLAPERWVKSLIDITDERDRRDDDLFVAVRGPHSARLRTWLLNHVAGYDVVLAQGVPFSTPVEVTEIAARHGVPIVLLPHFHMDDRYYHWRRYYDAFRRATSVIAPAMVKSAFLDVIGATGAVAPGGGIDPREYDESNLDRGREAFRALHTATTPFVLVLGRKAGGKNYRLTIDAVAELNRGNYRVDLVLIGPNDDGLAVTEPHTCYYGAQPRDVVLGALSLALCLVNMSDSESFGIVLLEAWLAGRPVVAQRRCMAFSELVASGENGYLAESPSEIACAIETYLTDPEVAARHARQGRVVAEQYAWSHVAERIERILLDAALSSYSDAAGANRPASAQGAR